MAAWLEYEKDIVLVDKKVASMAFSLVERLAFALAVELDESKAG